MINHARTILLNREALGRPAIGTYGEEYIPPNFKKKVLPGYLTRFHQVLFGSYGDAVYENFRMAQYKIGRAHV